MVTNRIRRDMSKKPTDKEVLRRGADSSSIARRSIGTETSTAFPVPKRRPGAPTSRDKSSAAALPPRSLRPDERRHPTPPVVQPGSSTC